jgi:hypothetical protein
VQSVTFHRWTRSTAVLMAVGILILLGFSSDASAAPSIRFKGSGLDVFNFHGRVALLPPTHGGPVDPVADGFGLELRNEFGVIYETAIGPDELVDRGNLRYRFKDKLSKAGAGSHGGLYHIINRFRQYAGVWYYTVRIRAYTDLSAATEPLMTLLIYEVNGPASVTAAWVQKKNGWKLPRNRF